MNISQIVAKLNPFSSPEAQEEQEHQGIKEIFRKLDEEVAENARGVGDILDAFVSDYANINPSVPFSELGRLDQSTTVEMIFRNKMQRIMYYREMSFYPPTSKALDIITDECVVKDQFNKYATMDVIPNFAEKMTDVEKKQLQVDFDYVMKTVFRSTGMGSLWSLFRKWLIEGELFLEMIPSKNKKKLVGIRVLPALFTFPVYREGVLLGFKEAVLSKQLMENPSVQGYGTIFDNEQVKSFEYDEIAYSNFGEFGFSKQDVIGYLETGKRSYAQLRQTEDSMIIYRRNRAIERLIFGVATGNNPKWKADQIIEDFKKKFNRINRYDPINGEVQNNKNHITMTENYFIPTTNGEKTDVQTLAAAGSFANQIDDMKMFLALHYEALKIPKTRWGAETETPFTNKHEMALEEMNFEKFCSRLIGEENFGKIIYDVFIKHLQLRGYPEKYLDRSLYRIQLNRNTHFELFKKFELEQTRAELLNSLGEKMLNVQMIKDGIEGDALFSKEFMMKNILGFSDEELIKNKDLLAKEINDMKINMPKAEGGGADAMGGMGDFSF